MTDTHAHLSGLAAKGFNPHALLPELFASQLRRVIDISLEPGDLASRINEFSRYKEVRFASGLWPHADSVARRAELVPALEKEITAAPPGLVAAVGEFGLDHHYDDEEANHDFAGERELMEMQIDLARRLALPVVIHSRDAPGETIEILKQFPGTRGIIHCFSYTKDEAKIFLDMGFHISFAGNLTYKNAQNLRDACAAVPADRLLLETDSPWLAPVPFRGKPCHPGMVAETYKAAAALRGVELEELIEQIEANVRGLFGKNICPQMNADTHR
jgi:TatD DNase family protein